MTETELAAVLKAGDIRGAFFFYGEEDYLKNHRTAEIRRLVIGDYEAFAAFNAMELFFGDGELDLGAITDALHAPPMLAPQKLVVLSFASIDSLKEKDRTALLTMLSEAMAEDDGSTVLIVKVAADGLDAGTAKKPSSFLAQAGKFMHCVSFAYQSESRLQRWAERHFAEYGLVATPQVIGMIFATAGRSMYRLSGEIAKVAAYVAQAGRREVTAADVAACVTRTDADDAFALANCVVEGNAPAALSALGVKIRLREEPIILLSQITRAFGDLCAASAFLADGRDKAEFAKEMRMHEYKAGLYYRAARLRAPEFFLYAADACVAADRALKSSASASDPYAIIERLICSLAEG